MEPQVALEKYARAVIAIKDYAAEPANKSIFDKHNKLMLDVIDAENDLRDAVAESKQGIDNGQFKVVVTPVTQTVYDEEMIKAKMPEAIKIVERPIKISISEINHGGSEV